MTVRDLIDYLGTLHPEQRVMLSGWEGGYDDVAGAYEVSMALDTNPNHSASRYLGEHGPTLGTDPDERAAYAAYPQVPVYLLYGRGGTPPREDSC